MRTALRCGVRSCGGLIRVLAHTLHFDQVDPPQKVAFLVHGIMGSRRNWSSMARRLSSEFPHWGFVSIDLRGHGDSPRMEGGDTVQQCAQDLRALSRTLAIDPRIIVGHSFGGKVALEYGAMDPPGLKSVWSLDSPPGFTQGVSQVADVIAAAREAPLPVEHRLAMVPYFESRGFDRSIGAWMTTNLKKTDDGFHWRFDLDVIERLIEDYRTTDLWPFLESPSRDVYVHFVVAGRSDWWKGPARDRLEALDRSSVNILESAGHWVHSDDPEGLTEFLSESFSTP